MADFETRNTSQQIGNVTVAENAVAYVGIFSTPATGDGTGLQALAFKEMNQRLHDVAEAATDTCHWIFQHEAYLQWQQQDHGLLWIKGNPGVGKSTLMKRLFARYRDQPEKFGTGVMASFFCHGRGSALQHSHSGVFRALLHQVLLQNTELRSAFDAEFRARCDQRGRHGEKWDWHESELKATLKDYLLKASSNRVVYVFVDALDECEEAAHLLAFFTELISVQASSSVSTLTLKVCVSSRHYPVIGTENSLGLNVEQANASDIRMYVLQQLENSIDDEQVVQTLEEDIVSRASYVFQWATLVTQRVITSWTQRKELRAIRRDIQTTPEELHDLYRDLVRNVEATEKAQFQRLIEWVALAGTALTINALRSALVVDPSYDYFSVEEITGSEDYMSTDDAMAIRVRHLSRGLVEVIYEEHIPESEAESGSDSDLSITRAHPNLVSHVQFIHQSVQDYFTIGGGLAETRNLSQPSSLSLIHIDLAKACVRYMRACTPQKPRPYTYSRSRHVDGFMDYAAHHWIWHIKQANDQGACETDILFLLRQPYHIFGLGWEWLERILNTCHNGRFCMTCSTTLLSKRWSLLQFAESFGIDAAVKAILNKKGEALVDAYDEGRRTPLSLAAEGGHIEVIRVLLSTELATSGNPVYRFRSESMINNKDAPEKTPLHHAIGSNCPEAVKLILQSSKVDIEIRDGEDGFTPLLLAVCSKQESMVRLLLAHGADFTATCCEATGLDLAARVGSSAIARMFLQKGLSVDGRGKRSPLQLATSSGSLSTFLFLLESGATGLREYDSDGRTLLSLASSGKGVEIMTFLLPTENVNPDSKDNEWRTPFSHAAEAFNMPLEKLKLLHSAGMVDPDSRDNYQRTPLSYAAACEDYQGTTVVEFLLSLVQVRPDSQDSTGRTPLSYAAENGSWSNVKMLLSTGKVNPHAKDEENTSSIEYAKQAQMPWYGKEIEREAWRRQRRITIQLMEDYVKEHGFYEEPGTDPPPVSPIQEISPTWSTVHQNSPTGPTVHEIPSKRSIARRFLSFAKKHRP